MRQLPKRNLHLRDTTYLSQFQFHQESTFTRLEKLESHLRFHNLMKVGPRVLVHLQARSLHGILDLFNRHPTTLKSPLARSDDIQKTLKREALHHCLHVREQRLLEVEMTG
jgi:hypothetical protein